MLAFYVSGFQMAKERKGRKRVCLSALLAQKPKDEVYWGYPVDSLTVRDDVLVHL